MFTLPKLDYRYDALAPHISAEIMELHYSKHHQTYIDKLNAALKDYPEWQSKTIEEILTSLESIPEAIRQVVRNNGGGHYNHSLFWRTLSPDGGQPKGELLAGLNGKYESFENFKEQFTAAALGVFGSGWAWVLPDLTITTTPNQDSPLSNVGITPFLGLDVWLHVYYLHYKNTRPDYIAAWWNVIDWRTVERSFIEK